MDGRQRIAAALSPEGAPEIPVVLCYEGIYLRDHWDGLTGVPWWHEADPDLETQVRWRSEAMARMGQDWFHLPSCRARAEREALSIVPEDGVARLVDRRTGAATIVQRPLVGGWQRGGAAASLHPAAPPLSRELVDEAIPLPRGDVASEVRAEGLDDLARLLCGGPGRTLFPIRHVGSPFWLCYGLWGFEGLMTLVADDPDLVRHACSRLLETSVREARRAAALGAEGIWVEECLTDMLAAADYRRLAVPFLDALLREIRALGMRSIYYYCGDPAGKWEPILSLPVDALALEEGKKGFRIDIEDVVDRVGGRMCLLGNLDAVHLLPQADEPELEAEIGRQIRAGRRNRGRFLMSLGSPVTPGTSVQRVSRFCAIACRLGGGR